MLLKGSFEDFFYILIGIVWIAFSIYQGQKKRKQKLSAPSTTEKKKSFFETLLDEVTEKKQAYEEIYDSESESTPEIVNQEERTYEENKFSYDDYYEERNYEETEDVIIKNEPLAKSDFDHPIRANLKKTRKLHFDLKKAVIYSEILKPKYF